MRSKNRTSNLEERPVRLEALLKARRLKVLLLARKTVCLKPRMLRRILIECCESLSFSGSAQPYVLHRFCLCKQRAPEKPDCVCMNVVHYIKLVAK